MGRSMVSKTEYASHRGQDEQKIRRVFMSLGTSGRQATSEQSVRDMAEQRNGEI